jgi:cysteine synthase
VCTDSIDLYRSRLTELEKAHGAYSRVDAACDYHRHLLGESTANVRELTYYDRKQIHNLKYFTWIEQQGKDLDELNAQWYDYPDYWERIRRQTEEIDRLIEEFNRLSGLQTSY